MLITILMISRKEKPQNKENPSAYTDWWEKQENSIKCKNPKQSPKPALLWGSHCLKGTATSSPSSCIHLPHALWPSAITQCSQRPNHSPWAVSSGLCTPQHPVQQNLRLLLLGAHGQGRVQPAAWEHLLVLGHERLHACMRAGSHRTPKSWTGPEHCFGAAHVQPLKEKPNCTQRCGTTPLREWQPHAETAKWPHRF